MKYFVLILLSSLFFLNSCISTHKNSEGNTSLQQVPQLQIPAQTQTQQKFLKARLLTSVGENYDAHFSPGARSIVFHSKLRPEHQQAQIYILNMSNLRERRLSYHDGDDSHAQFSNDGKLILYASTTDEIKSEDLAIQSVMKTYNPKLVRENSKNSSEMAFELYVTKLESSEVFRLTNTPGYDSEPSFDNKSQNIIFVSRRSGKSEIFMMPFHYQDLMQSKSKTISLLRPSAFIKGTQDDVSPAWSTDGDKLAWIRWSLDKKNSQLMIANKLGQAIQVLTTKSSVVLNPSFHPNNQDLVFSSNRSDEKHLKLFSIDIKTKCLKQLTEGDSDDNYPAFSPDGKQLLFTSNINGRNQIYLTDYSPPQNCLNELP